MDKVREAFEKHMGIVAPDKPLYRNSDGEYGWYGVEDRWIAYQAAHKDAIEQFNINEIANTICRDLPEDFEIQIHLENGSGWVELHNFNNDGVADILLDENDGIAGALKDALKQAIDQSNN